MIIPGDFQFMGVDRSTNQFSVQKRAHIVGVCRWDSRLPVVTIVKSALSLGMWVCLNMFLSLPFAAKFSCNTEGTFYWTNEFRWVASIWSALRQGSRTTTSFLQSTLRMTDVPNAFGPPWLIRFPNLKNLFVLVRGTNNNIVGTSQNFDHTHTHTRNHNPIRTGDRSMF